MSLRRRGPPVAPLALDALRRLPAPGPLDVARLLCGRSNPGRAQVLETLLRAAGPVTREPFRTLEGGGVNLFVDLPAREPGGPVLVLAAHHDAVPGSPGANDNAASVGILLALRARLAASPLRRLAVRLAFFAAEERAMLGSRVHVRRAARRGELSPLAGVVSLELCGIGDTFALWDVTPALERTPLLAAWGAALEGLGHRRDADAGYYFAEPVPFFGSDHRPYAERGVPAVGLTVVPAAAVEPLRAFIYGGLRGVLVPPARRPAPFTTYHTGDDGPATLDPRALGRVTTALEALCRVLDG
jgi:hypothetical protein